LDYVVGYISGQLTFVREALEAYGWRQSRARQSDWIKDGRCIKYVRTSDQLHGV
jgi:hypothetical protein